MNRRQFTLRSFLTLVTFGLAGSAFKCGSSEKVSTGIQTITVFMNEIAGIIPSKAAVIARIVKIASDFDIAFRRGDFSSSATLLDTLESNLKTFIADVEVNISDRVKTLLAIVGATLKMIAVLIKGEGARQPAVVAASRARSAVVDSGAKTVERLADPKAVDALFQAARP